MAVPNYQAFMQPLLHVLNSQYPQPVKLSEVENKVYTQLNLTAEELKQRIPSGKQTYSNHRLNWAKTYLVQAGLITQPKRAYCVISDAGKAALSCGEQINNAYLKQFSSFKDFVQRSKKANVTSCESETQKPVENDEQTPEEVIESAVETMNTSLRDELLNSILAASPLFFENLVVDLMLAMGYGGSRQDAGQATQYTQDGGIDGIIKEDKLGLEMIYLQAKRYTDKTVGRPDIQAFAGALDMHRAKKGVFITTSGFSKEAKAYVNMVEKRIVLVDGEQLSALMLSHNLGVSTKYRFEVKVLDSDYFLES